MLKLNSELRAQAREALRGKWPMAAVAALIYSAIAGGLSAIPVIGGLCSLFVGLPVAYGFTIVMLGVCRGKDIDFGVLFEGFQDYGRIFVTMLLQAVYTILWSLLLSNRWIQQASRSMQSDYLVVVIIQHLTSIHGIVCREIKLPLVCSSVHRIPDG